MRKMTEGDLKGAFAGESQAHTQYLIFAEKAEEESLRNEAELLRAIVYTEQVHVTNHYNVLGMIQGTGDNLQAAIDGETYEVNETYPAYKAVAEPYKEKGARRSTAWALQGRKSMLPCIKRPSKELKEGRTLRLDRSSSVKPVETQSRAVLQIEVQYAELQGRCSGSFKIDCSS